MALSAMRSDTQNVRIRLARSLLGGRACAAQWRDRDHDLAIGAAELPIISKFYKHTVVRLQGPQVVSMADVSDAKATLRRLSDVDVDAFLEQASVAHLLTTPLGLSERCLSVNELADQAALIRENSDIASGDLRLISDHIGSCSECRANLATYLDVEEKSTYESLEGGLSAFVCHQDKIIATPFEAEQLDFVLCLRGIEPEESVKIVPNSVVIDGVCQAHGCTLERIAPPPAVGHTISWRANFRPSWRQLPEDVLEGTFCDIVKVSGETEGGMSFSGRSLICFSR